jgi:wobble nucleotide-excising tRNase
LGKGDVDIASMIQKLGNSDWVKEGISYLENAEGLCPFCQEPAPSNLAARLAEYFDETFAKDTASIAEVLRGYKLEGERLQQSLQSAINSASKFLDLEKLKSAKAIFDSRFQLAAQRIEGKRKEPSQIVALDPTGPVLAEAKSLVADANQKIKAHNLIVSNLTTERQKLTKEVWAFLAGPEIKTKLAAYQQVKGNVDKAIASLEKQIAEAESDKATKEDEIHKLERSTTSIQPTVNDINKILKSFGFRNFSLGTAPGGSLYQIRRPDGTDAKTTLSEGEESFITFLYFFHLLKGSESSSGMTQDRVVVFDDPVSSLDSDILFIVGSLIRQVIEDARAGIGHIKQVFVLTHNVYFHKEVTFNPQRRSGVLKGETFWTVCKTKDVSTLRKHDLNPIKTSYELMWSEVRTPNLASQTLQNTLRRILENYFCILGHLDKDGICNQFDGHERLICKSLFSWMNEGSHSIPDDLYIVSDEKTMETFLTVFHMVFARTQHESHYKMMMGDAYKELPEVTAS